MARGRWFIALPAEGALLSFLPRPPAGIRLVDEDDLHVTIAYLGHCGESAAYEAFSGLESLQASLDRPVPFSLGRIEPLGPRGAYTALGADIVGDDGWTSTLSEQWRDPLIAKAGGRLDPRPSRPHLTIARPSRSAGDGTRSEGLKWASSLDLNPAHGTFSTVALYSAVSGLANRRYGIVASIPLVR